ncbi:hypothetical protein EYF80_053338 [Liparis tanakae]|uniref:Uncharacterized protein n=1 Tax=Liparis tanakae TaxID=230148 RepID=A0A4Z2F5R1_9TELE|nr:hypothetical protein EYF80_053338 [Liparis tanakae]
MMGNETEETRYENQTRLFVRRGPRLRLWDPDYVSGTPNTPLGPRTRLWDPDYVSETPNTPLGPRTRL